MNFLAVFIGGGLGSLARYSIDSESRNSVGYLQPEPWFPMCSLQPCFGPSCPRGGRHARLADQNSTGLSLARSWILRGLFHLLHICSGHLEFTRLPWSDLVSGQRGSEPHPLPRRGLLHLVRIFRGLSGGGPPPSPTFIPINPSSMPTTFTLTRTLACTFCLIALLASNASGQIGFP